MAIKENVVRGWWWCYQLDRSTTTTVIASCKSYKCTARILRDFLFFTSGRNRVIIFHHHLILFPPKSDEAV